MRLNCSYFLKVFSLKLFLFRPYILWNFLTCQRQILLLTLRSLLIGCNGDIEFFNTTLDWYNFFLTFQPQIVLNLFLFFTRFRLALIKFVLILKVACATFLPVCFLKSKREDLWNLEKRFVFHFKSSFHSRVNQILEF